MCMARNSVGEGNFKTLLVFKLKTKFRWQFFYVLFILECYVSDEIITARSGKRIRVGNTDAEGRMVMVDLLCEAKEAALKETNPQLFTIATLTGHVIRAYGPNYSVSNFKTKSYILKEYNVTLDWS